MSRKMVMIEVGVKTCIIFLLVGFIDYKMKYYIVSNYGEWQYFAFLFVLYGTAFTAQHFYFKNRIQRIIKEGFFNKHVAHCKELYGSVRKDLLTDSKKFFNAPFDLIQVIGIHEYVIEAYTDRELIADYVKTKQKLLEGLSKEDSEVVMEEVKVMKHILAQMKFKFRK